MSERIQGVREKVYKGIKYRSTLEADTAQTLDKLGVPFVYEGRRITLLEGFHTPFQKDKVRAIHYTPDFEIGPVIIECKGFETPEWKNKKKYIFKYLMEKEPYTIFYQTHNSSKDILLALDRHWPYLGYAIQVTPKPSKKQSDTSPQLFDSVAQAVDQLGLTGKPLTPILRSLTGDKEYVYNYNWKLIKITL